MILKQRPAYKFNIVSNKWEPVMITPKIYIPENGRMTVRDLKELAKITSLNGRLYASESEIEHREELAKGTHEGDTFAFVERIENGLTANFNPIFLCPMTGSVVGGNTTTQTLYDIVDSDDNNYTLDNIIARVEYADYVFDDDCPNKEKMKKLFEYNKTGKRDEMSFSAIYDRVTAFFEQYHRRYPWVCGGSSYRTQYWKSNFQEILSWFKNDDYPMDTKKLKWIMDFYTLPEKLKSEFEKQKKNLDWTSAEKLLNTLTREKNSKKENPNKFDFVKLVRENQEIKDAMNKSIKSSINQVKDIYTRKNKQGKIIPHYHKTKGVMSCSIAGAVSHKIMFDLVGVFENIEDENLRNRLQCITESGKQVSGKDTVIPDLSFPILSDEYLKEDKNYDKATMEIKVATHKPGSTVLFYGGPGFKMITETPYLFVVVDKELTECIVILKNLHKELVSTSSTVKMTDVLNKRGDFVQIVGTKKNKTYYYEKI